MALRLRVVAAVEAGTPQKAVAGLFQVGEATVYRWVARKRKEGHVAPKPKGGNNPRSIPPRGEKLLRQLLQRKPDRTLAELVGLLAKRRIQTSQASVSRTLKRLNITLKKRPCRLPNDRGQKSSS